MSIFKSFILVFTLTFFQLSAVIYIVPGDNDSVMNPDSPFFEAIQTNFQNHRIEYFDYAKTSNIGLSTFEAQLEAADSFIRTNLLKEKQDEPDKESGKEKQDEPDKIIIISNGNGCDVVFWVSLLLDNVSKLSIKLNPFVVNGEKKEDGILSYIVRKFNMTHINLRLSKPKINIVVEKLVAFNVPVNLIQIEPSSNIIKQIYNLYEGNKKLLNHDNCLDIYVPNMFSRSSLLVKLIKQLFCGCSDSGTTLNAASIQTINCIKKQSILNNSVFSIYEIFENNSFLLELVDSFGKKNILKNK